MGALEGTGTKFPNGINVNAGETFIDDVAMTASAVELNKNTGVTAGTVTASKTVVAGANGEVAGLTLDSATNYVKNTVVAYAANITTAQLNTGLTLIPAVAGKTIRVTRLSVKINGAFNSGAGTSIIFQDTHTSPVAILTIAKAAATDGAYCGNDRIITNVTIGAGSTANLTASKGIAIAADAGLSAVTSIDVVLEYMYV
jgi:hypothetical protein